MRERFIIFALSAICFSGCTLNEITTERSDSDRISFESSVYKTKASSVNKEIMHDNAYPGFKTFALKNDDVLMSEITNPTLLPIFMDQLKVKCNDKVWQHDGVYYWPVNPEHKISFFANAPYMTESENSILSNIKTNEDCVYFDLNIPSSPVAQKDILAAATHNINKKEDINDKNVNLHFKHILSRIKFAAYIPAEKNTSFRITEVKISYGKMVAEIELEPVYTSGRFIYNLKDELNVGHTEITNNVNHLNGTFELSPASELNPILINPGDNSVAMHDEDQALMILPQDQTGKYIFNIYLTYQTSEDKTIWSDKKNFTFFFKGNNFMAGKSYLYNIDISQLLDIVEIGFGNPEVSIWSSEL